MVEDNPGDIRLIKAGFDESSVDGSLTVVTDGEEALDYLYQRNGYRSTGKPDFLFLDLNVPKKTGSDILERIDGDIDLRSIPILVLTGSRADNHVLETYRMGADGYFVKPVDPNEFMSLVETVVDTVSSSGALPPGEFAGIDHGK
ncbi:response regulator [Natronorubrum sp. JWXQ-INN-674]|uniref:Response regulator n=1 Tax=Natronorubrum halalkaliphilum TaxID=2691917 RepID=A0A6B0VMF9_9EURY|nr:response regulator [Natronorubrum halalkaliphilum]MXV63021.1 response regulator [Natronorubrum halalkaliphilum]